MGILDNLAIMAAGAGRGYRASQETQRQIAEARRAALLQEREQALREQQARQQYEMQTAAATREAALGQAQIGQLGAEQKYHEAQTGEIQGRTQEGNLPITQGGQPLRFNILGNQLEFPGKLSTLTRPELQPLIGESMREANMNLHPELYGGSRRTPLTPEERLMHYLDTVGHLEPTNVESAGAGDFAKRQQQALDMLLQNDPEAANIREAYLSKNTKPGSKPKLTEAQKRQKYEDFIRKHGGK